MATVISADEWDQGKAGIQLETLIYELDRLIIHRRMSIEQAEKYVLTYIVKDDNSNLHIKRHSTMQDTVVISYLNMPDEFAYVGFSVPICSLYKVLCDLKRRRAHVETVKKT